jgi:hypothetical protein
MTDLLSASGLLQQNPLETDLAIAPCDVRPSGQRGHTQRLVYDGQHPSIDQGFAGEDKMTLRGRDALEGFSALEAAGSKWRAGS